MLISLSDTVRGRGDLFNSALTSYVLAQLAFQEEQANFRGTLQKNLLGIYAHVNVLEKNGNGVENWRELREKLVKIPHVTGAAPVLYGGMYAKGPKQSAVASGVKPGDDRVDGGSWRRGCSRAGPGAPDPPGAGGQATALEPARATRPAVESQRPARSSCRSRRRPSWLGWCSGLTGQGTTVVVLFFKSLPDQLFRTSPPPSRTSSSW